MTKTSPQIAIIGATGNVGRKIVELLLERKIANPHQLQLFASAQSKGKQLTLQQHTFNIHSANQIDFKTLGLCIFATDSDISALYIPAALQQGVPVIDSSSLHRLAPHVPLIVAPVNKALVVLSHAQLYAIANCVASPIAIVLAALQRSYTIKHVNIATYQATSGMGKAAMDELTIATQHQLAGENYHCQHFARSIAFNVIPQIGNILPNGYTQEEEKIRNELAKIIDTDFTIAVTAVRVPIMIGHSAALSIEFNEPIQLDAIRASLAQGTGIQLSEHDYQTPIEIVGSDDVHVGRIRLDPSNHKSLQLWLCSDNLRRGAATDAVEVAQLILQQLN